MGETIDTYFDAWNATDDAERRSLIERCLTSDVELIDENGRFSGHLELSWLSSIKRSPPAESSRRGASTSSRESPAIPGTLLMPRATPGRAVLMLLKRTRTGVYSAS
jgi:hypothetical protein